MFKMNRLMVFKEKHKILNSTMLYFYGETNLICLVKQKKKQKYIKEEIEIKKMKIHS